MGKLGWEDGGMLYYDLRDLDSGRFKGVDVAYRRAIERP